VNDTVPILLSVIAATDDRPSLGNAARDAVPIILLAVFILGILFGLLLLAYVPGHVARKRCHPSAQAISICGVLGLLIWPLWIVAYIWAYTGPDLSKARPAPRPVEPRGLACDGCGRPMDISQARQIGARLICPSCLWTAVRPPLHRFPATATLGMPRPAASVARPPAAENPTFVRRLVAFVTVAFVTLAFNTPRWHYNGPLMRQPRGAAVKSYEGRRP
jgi:hypothetical protein